MARGVGYRCSYCHTFEDESHSAVFKHEAGCQSRVADARDLADKAERRAEFRKEVRDSLADYEVLVRQDFARTIAQLYRLKVVALTNEREAHYQRGEGSSAAIVEVKIQELLGAAESVLVMANLEIDDERSYPTYAD